MSCLTDREKIALEDIFLSISVNQSPFEKYKNTCAYYAPVVKARAKNLAMLTKSYKLLPLYVEVKSFLGKKRDKLGRKMGFSRHT